jgi:hypothetical protein
MTIIRQGNPTWGHSPVGIGSSTFGAVGCLVCCIQQAALSLVDGAITPDPRIANMRGVDAGAFVGSAAIIDKLAEANHMRCEPKIEGDVVKLRAVVIQALTAGGKVLLHVDHDSARPKGDPEADHWVLALRLEPSQVVCSDPATGAECRISTVTLDGPSGWKDGRRYVVKGVRVLNKR